MSEEAPAVAPESAAPADGEPAAAPERDYDALQQQHRALAVTAAKRDRELAHIKQQLEQANGRLSPDDAIALSEIKGDAKAALKVLADRAGVTFDQMAQAVVDSDGAQPSAGDLRVQQLENTIAELKEQLGGVQESAQTREQQERRQTRLSSIRSFTDGKDELSVVHALGAHEVVLSAIEQEERSSGIAATQQDVIEALSEFEQNTRSTITEQVKALAALPWARELFESAAKQATSETDEDQQASEDPPAPSPKRDRKARRRSKTVTNADASESATPADANRRALSKDRLVASAVDRIKRRRASA